MLPSIRAIFFDFGSTLIYTNDPWPPIYLQADRAMVASLRRSGIPLDESTFITDFQSFLDIYYADRGAGIIEKTTSAALQELLASKGYRAVPEAVIRSALDALYAVTQQNWYLEDDAISTLETLRARGIRLGMISNTSDDKNVQQLLDRWSLRPYFESIITSAACGIRKPDERIFHLALKHFGFPPEQTAMVGDAPEADILGANRLGMYAIWLTRRAVTANPAPARPDSIVTTLEEIPTLPLFSN